MRESRKYRKLINKNLDNIYSTAYAIAKDWDKNTIPLTTLEAIINKSRPDTNTGILALDVFIQNYNKMLDSFFASCNKIASNMSSKDIPISTIKEGINIMKKGFANGLSGIG